MSFPSPVGGFPTSVDFAPSVVFATLFGLLAVCLLYRLYDRKSRLVLLIGSQIFTIEHIVLFTLRAKAARGTIEITRGLMTYFQLDFATGPIGIAGDSVNFLRCLLVNTTWGDDTWYQCPEYESQTWSWLHEPDQHPIARPPPGTPDQPRRRFWYRRFANMMNLLILTATITGVVGNARYHETMDNQDRADWVGRLRYASIGVILFLTLILFAVSLWARTLPRLPKHACTRLNLIHIFVIIICIYRLSVMYHTTTSLDSTAPGSQNSTRDKALFYVFHILPEWLAQAIFFGTNMRQTYQTGIFGDRRFRDETEKEKESRLKREKTVEEKRKKRAEKIAAKKLGGGGNVNRADDLMDDELERGTSDNVRLVDVLAQGNGAG